MSVEIREIRPCNDCGVEPGEPHEDGCDVARCLWTGFQRLSCGQGLLYVEDPDDYSADELIWMEWPDTSDDGLRDQPGNTYREARVVDPEDPDHDCGEDIWTGEWPDTAQCREFGWYCYWGPDLGEQGWQPIASDDIEALGTAHPGVRVTEDLNRLATEAQWDRSAQRWVRRED